MDSRAGLPIGGTISHYRILGLLGTGGMGAVYRARDERLDRDVALKVLLAESVNDLTARARLVREARMASSLNHPHIAHVYDVGEDGERLFIAMEVVEGRTLSRGPSPTQIADALGYATGTPNYLPPEVLRGEPVDARSDIWALGVVLYEMAAGKLPFDGGSLGKLSEAIQNGAPSPLSGRVPIGIQAVIGRCLAKDPGQRYRQGSEVRAAIEALIGASPARPRTAREGHGSRPRGSAPSCSQGPSCWAPASSGIHSRAAPIAHASDRWQSFRSPTFPAIRGRNTSPTA